MKKSLLTFTVGRKLLFAFLVLVLMLCFLGFASLSSEKRMADNTKVITTNWLSGVEIANNINYLTEHVLNYQLRILSEADKTKKADDMKEASKLLGAVDDAMDSYAATYANEKDKATAEKLRSKWNAYKQVYEQAASLGTKVDLINGSGNKASEVVQIMDESLKAFEDMQLDLKQLVQLNHRGAEEATKESEDAYRNSRIEVWIIMAAAVVIAIFLVVLINASISRPIKRAAETLRRIADADLSVESQPAKSKDEIGTMIGAMNEMTDSLRSMMTGIRQAAGTLTTSSEGLRASSEQNAGATQHVAEAVQEVASGAERQQHSAGETSRAMEEMATGIQRIAETASTVADLTIEASRHARDGNEAIASAVERMNAISGSVDQAGADIEMLEGHSERIGEIVVLIGDIASQTGLLSLNASIEAARAGEQGRGFAVVASEVKKLSEQSAESVHGIAEVIAEIQRDTLKAVQTMQRSRGDVQRGIDAVSGAERAFGQIVATARQVAERVQEVAAAAQQMAAGSEEVSASVHDMSAISREAAQSTQSVAAATEEQLASVQEITAAAQSLSSIAQGLSDMVGKFKM
ncbi:methyl-accepting chemotaxis protein [Paenibacillus rhizovicinus]|uniref:Methyl-accepting chemotaxis protein n=1 Tax=Paenibacillus rhizovicinus TaxID=2704463 RepID=A0A6C0NZV8_9BACL|nr:methyl-accepting chemotaxis protein [Paenibacillus rhizovicinus]QHW31758.1 methyl-accepting chemotaxis protein [Paenibacillus rhizovicinus]